MRRTLGMAAFSGMLGVTVFGIFLTPVFYSALQRLTDWWSNTPDRPANAQPPKHASRRRQSPGVAIVRFYAGLAHAPRVPAALGDFFNVFSHPICDFPTSWRPCDGNGAGYARTASREARKSFVHGTGLRSGYSLPDAHFGII